MAATASIADTIKTEIREVARQQNKTLPPLENDLPLLDSGLDSLCLAILVARLEDELGLDPFSAEAIAFPVTLGEFIRLYEIGGQGAG